VINTKKDENAGVASRMERFPGNRKVKRVKSSSIQRKLLID
jgi:hypothetical protein